MKLRHDHKGHELYWLYEIITKNHATTIKKINELNNQLKTIIMGQASITQDIKTVTAQLVKIGAESTITLQKVADLEVALGNQDNASQELTDAVAALKTQAQVVDDLTPDAPAAG